MNLSQIAAAALALLLLGTGAAVATPGAAPSDAGAQADDATNDDSAGPPDAAGPPSDMPDPVPEFVHDIHGQIDGFLDGSVPNLGAAIADVTPGDESAGADADDTATGSDATASPTPTPAA